MNRILLCLLIGSLCVNISLQLPLQEDGTCPRGELYTNCDRCIQKCGLPLSCGPEVHCVPGCVCPWLRNAKNKCVHTCDDRYSVSDNKKMINKLIASRGPNAFEDIFGDRARDEFRLLGGIEKVAKALTNSQTIDDFKKALSLSTYDTENLRSMLLSVENNTNDMLESIGLSGSDLIEVKKFMENLLDTAFI